MFNYEPEDLAAATSGAGGKRRMSCYCGVPASPFTTGGQPGVLADFGERIARVFAGRVIVCTWETSCPQPAASRP
jgi:hypothetical protein